MNTASAAALAVLRRAAEQLLTDNAFGLPLKSIFSELALPDTATPPLAFFAARSFRIECETLFPVLDSTKAKEKADPDLLARFQAAYKRK